MTRLPFDEFVACLSPSSVSPFSPSQSCRCLILASCRIAGSPAALAQTLAAVQAFRLLWRSQRLLLRAALCPKNFERKQSGFRVAATQNGDTKMLGSPLLAPTPFSFQIWTSVWSFPRHSFHIGQSCVAKKLGQVHHLVQAVLFT